MDFRAYDRPAWDREVERGDRWTVPFGPEVIEAAREGRWEALPTEAKPVPRDWFPSSTPSPTSSWRRCARSGPRPTACCAVGGVLLAGFLNPAVYTLDLELVDNTGEVRVRYSLPYADATSNSEEEEARRQIERGDTLDFSHALEDQIGGQIDAGFVIAGFHEDRHRDDPIADHTPTYIATRAIK